MAYLLICSLLLYLQQEYMESTGLAVAATPATETLKAEVLCSFFKT